MGMENLLNYYFIMKKRFVTVLLACSLAGGLFAQQPWFCLLYTSDAADD